jgi:hypothetical protein
MRRPSTPRLLTELRNRSSTSSGTLRCPEHPSRGPAPSVQRRGTVESGSRADSAHAHHLVTPHGRADLSEASVSRDAGIASAEQTRQEGTGSRATPARSSHHFGVDNSPRASALGQKHESWGGGQIGPVVAHPWLRPREQLGRVPVVEHANASGSAASSSSASDSLA